MTIPNTIPFVIPPTTYIDTTLIPTISPTIPPSPDYIPASPDYSLAFDMEFDLFEDPSSDHIPPLPVTSPFLSSTDDSSNNDIPDIPPSPTYGTPFTETTLSTQRSPIASGALRLDYSSSDHLSLNDSSRDSSSSSSSETSSDSSTDALSDSASSHSSSDHSLPTPSLGMRPSHHLCSLRSRSPTASVPLSSPIPGALSYARTDLLPPTKRIRSPETATNLEGCSEDSFELYVPREAGLGVDIEDESSKTSRYRGTDLKMDVDVALRDRGINARVVVEAIDQEEIKTGVRGPVKVRVDRVTHPVIADDTLMLAQEGAVKVTYETLGDLVQRFHDHTAEILSADMSERIKELEQDNMRLRDMMDVASLRLVPGGIWATILRLFLEYPSVDPTVPNTRSRASRTCEGINKQIDRQMAGALGARNVARNLEPLMGDGCRQEEVNGNRGNRNGGNGNGNGGGNGYNFGGFVHA
ncbi:hypothetical protein Tco_0007386 [Tanacetum coccineum]